MRNVLIALLLSVSTHAGAQVPASRPSQDSIARGITAFEMIGSGVSSTGPVRPGMYVADQGRRAAALGDESGAFELWTWPLKLVRDFRLAFGMPGHDAPIDGAALARSVTVRAEGVTIVYTHASFTVRQHLFVPLDEPGIIVLLDVETTRPLDVHVRMHADFNLAWPGSFGGGYITWLADSRQFLLSQGGVRHYNALIGSPHAGAGTAHAAHDAPTTPSQFSIHIPAGTARADFIPIVVAGGALPRDSIAQVYRRLLANAPQYWRAKVAHYRRVEEDLVSVGTPEARLDEAFAWAKANLDQQLVCNPDLGCGLVAGYGRAGPGNYRPGFAWYFGGDAAINTLALSALGAFELARTGLAFLAKYQRADGKIPHEISHAARRLPWFEEYPYTWFHGDTTPFWLLACYNYWLASADDDFIDAHWPAMVRAFRWSAATDTNGDGLMDNPAAGAGAIELGGLGEELLTDIYLAGVWAAALDGVQQLARYRRDEPTRAHAARLAAQAQRTLENAFWLEARGIYAFGLLKPDRADAAAKPRVNDALTVWPATALAFGLLDPERGDRMLREAGSSAITTDWGTRMLSRDHPLYDPLHYNNGTVWPFVTGFAALAHFAHHRTWAGYDLVRDVARASLDFAHGRTPELLSGAFYQTLDTAVPQQFFATSMLVTPLLRGLIGWTVDAPRMAAALEPHLPADWTRVTVTDLRVGRDRLSAAITHERGVYTVALRRQTAGAPISLRVAPALPLGARIQRIVIDDADVAIQAEESLHDVHGLAELRLARDATVEFHYDGGVDVVAAPERVRVGDGSRELKILDFRREGREYVLLVEGLAATTYTVQLRAQTRVRAVSGSDAIEQSDTRVQIRTTMPAGTGWVRKSLRFRI